MEKILLVILLGLHLSMGHFRIPWHPKLRTNKYKQLKPFRPSPKISDSSWKISYYYGNGVFRSYPTVISCRTHATLQTAPFAPQRTLIPSYQKPSGRNKAAETTKHEKGNRIPVGISTNRRLNVADSTEKPQNVMPLLPGRNNSSSPAVAVEETEDNLVLDFSNGGPPSLVISTADQPKVLSPSEVQELGARQFSILLEIVKNSGFNLSGFNGAELTIFAPSDKAFLKAFPNREFENFTQEDSQGLVSKHIIVGRIGSDSLLTQQVFTPTGQELKFEKEDQRIFLLLPDGRRIALLQTDIETDFGLLHEVESVLL